MSARIYSMSHQHPFRRSSLDPSLLCANMDQSGINTALLETELNTPAKNCYRLVVFGSAKVGKTCIVHRFLTGSYEEQYTPTIEDFHRKIYKIRGEIYRLDVLDTSGNNPFPAMNRLSILTGDVFLLVYSIDSRESFQEALRLRQLIIETKRTARIKSVPMVIVGNKCDIPKHREVDLDKAKRMISVGKRCSFMEVSAKENIQIAEMFQILFEHARLPSEMAPAMHKCMSGSTSPNTSPNMTQKGGIGLRKRISDACGVVSPNARRPSLRSDLLQVRDNALRGRGKKDDEDDDVFDDNTLNKKKGCVVQ